MLIIIVMIIIIVTLIVIDLYIIIKDKDNDNIDENNAQNKDNKKYLKRQSPCEWSFLTIAITITTNETLITDKTLTVEEKKIKQRMTLIYYIQTRKRLPCLICSVKMTLVKIKRGICL